MSGVNRHVDWINCTYHNQQRFINYTRNAPQEVINQLDLVGLLMQAGVLHMILVEGGGFVRRTMLHLYS